LKRGKKGSFDGVLGEGKAVGILKEESKVRLLITYGKKWS